MSYSVKLTEEVVTKINSWRLSKREIQEIRQGLHSLTSNPKSQLIRVGRPYDALQYDLVITDAGEPRRDVLYSFTSALWGRRSDAVCRGLRTYRRISCSIDRRRTGKAECVLTRPGTNDNDRSSEAI